MASLGKAGPVEPEFQPAADVPNGGVLLALPALLANGLLRHTDKHFTLPKGYYGICSIFLFLSFMLLSRIRSAENLRYCPPGEWGKLLGLDRSPEVKYVREKIALLAKGSTHEWSASLCQDWMNEHPEDTATLYIDGHVRVYHGKNAKLPKHYVSRQKLCLRGTCDYWVNSMNSNPFFVITKDVDPGLLQVLEQEIVPRLIKDIPNQPTEAQLQADPLLHRFILVFDREGYSPDFFLKMKKERIACLTYRKNPGDPWDESEFTPVTVKCASGEMIEMNLAERGVSFSCKGKQTLWMREIRRLMEGGHQTAVLSTVYRAEPEVQAASMFARWSQENFFKYMRQHYGLDKLVEYSAEDLPEETRVVNPKYRKLGSSIKSKATILNRKKARFASITIDGDIEEQKVKKYEKEKAELQEEISHIGAELDSLKIERKATPKHLQAKDLPKEEKLQRLSAKSKDFLDTMKMIAYRAETAMLNIVRETMSREDDGRSFIRSLYATAADLIPDKENGILRVRLHHMATHSANETARNLCSVLNDAEIIYPGTKLRVFYEMVS